MRTAGGPERLPNFSIAERGPLGAEFTAAGCSDFRSAVAHVRQLPYGRTSARGRYQLVLEEGRGTCSTKHAILAALAEEHGHGVKLMLGIYEMSEENTPGTGPVLSHHGLDCIPEAHCFLKAGSVRVDVTRGSGSGDLSMTLIHEEEIEPHQIDTYKPAVHRRFLTRWAEERDLEPEMVWGVREECIEALGEGEPE